MNAGNTAWLLVSSAMVLLMTPGLAFFYGGLVRERATINTIKMSFICLGLITVEWALVGYSLSFSPGTSFIGSLEWIGLSGVTAEPSELYGTTVPHLSFSAFQMMFAIITPALISGAVVGRMKFKAYAAFILVWSIVVYNPLCHWVWGQGGWLAELGALDFAGGTVVHISAGIAALVAALILGPRTPSASEDSPHAHRPHNVPFVVLGAGLLWFGWFGFNAGSALAADGIAAIAFMGTALSPAAAITVWIALENLHGRRKPTAVGASVAAVVGLVAITPAAGFVTPLAALAIGGIAASVSYFGMRWMQRTRLDDTLDVFACHGLGGITGALLTGVFASTQVNPGGADGLLYGNPGLLWPQFVGVAAAAAYSAVGTAVILYAIRAFMALRTSEENEVRGIDLAEHAESAYALEVASMAEANVQALLATDDSHAQIQRAAN